MTVTCPLVFHEINIANSAPYLKITDESFMLSISLPSRKDYKNRRHKSHNPTEFSGRNAVLAAVSHKEETGPESAGWRSSLKSGL